MFWLMNVATFTIAEAEQARRSSQLSTHSLFSPSKSSMWIACPGSLAFPENQETESGSNEFADNGTASHEWSALCLSSGKDAELFLGSVKEINGRQYTMDEERASFCQQYIDDVRRRAIGGMLLVEQWIDLSAVLDIEGGGTADTLIYSPKIKTLTCEDLKYGTGEKVYAQTDGEINSQLGLYLLGALADMELLGYEVESVCGVICQPRLGHIDEHTISVYELKEFGAKARAAREMTSAALINTRSGNAYLNPGEKQCRWCRAKANCPALSRYVSDQVKCDFDVIQSEPPLVAPRDTTKLGQAYLAVPLIEDWCRAVRSEVMTLTVAGTPPIGPDGKPYKLVEGREGARAWSDAEQAETALLGQLGPDKAYAPQKIITAPAAAKLLDKKATKALWTDVFEPLIKKPPGKPVLALGSDTRAPYTGAATADDFQETLSE